MQICFLGLICIGSTAGRGNRRGRYETYTGFGGYDRVTAVV